MAVAPGYDANRFSADAAPTRTRNRAVTDTYEPGSTFKLVTVAAALSEGLVTPRTRVHAPVLDPGRRPRDPRRASRAATETMTVARDPRPLVERRRDHARRAARARTGSQRWIDALRLRPADRHRLPGRERRDRAPVDQWSGSTIGNVPIGQGIAVTPIQMASAYAAIANGGVWLQPHLVDRVGGRPAPQPKHAADRRPRRRAQLLDDAAETSSPRAAPAPRPRSPATRSPARPARRRSRARTAVLDRRSTSRRSSASSRRAARARDPRLGRRADGAIWGGPSRRPRSRRSRSSTSSTSRSRRTPWAPRRPAPRLDARGPEAGSRRAQLADAFASSSGRSRPPRPGRQRPSRGRAGAARGRPG